MFSFLKRKHSPAASGAVDEAASVQAARTRARRRLIGAAVLVGLGIVGFPLLFETQPRPIAVNIPIEIPSRESAPPLSAPSPRATAATASAPASAPARSVASASAAAAVAATTMPAAEPPAPPAPPAPPVQKAEHVPAEAEPQATAALERSRDAQRAQALLEGKPVPSPATAPASAPEPKSSRFVVQAGAYTDATALREARQKVEKLGLKTYTQVIETDSGARTRVRVGPFGTRDEAEKAAARIKSAGLAVSILSL